MTVCTVTFHCTYIITHRPKIIFPMCILRSLGTISGETIRVFFYYFCLSPQWRPNSEKIIFSSRITDLFYRTHNKPKKIKKKPSITRTLMARLPWACLTTTSFRIPIITYMRLLWSNFCIYVFILLVSFSG